jgi:hypothetical protein
MEKYLIKKPQTTLDLLEDSLEEQKPFVLGVIGFSSSSFWTKETLLSSLLTPLIEEESKSPSSILVPDEGHTSILFQSWASHSKCLSTAYRADWKTLGKRARVLRDSRIMKESSHILFFLGARSDYYEKIAIREVKKGRIVYTVDPSSHELVKWEL